MGVQAVLDLKGKSEHNRLRIATPLHNFKENVMVETSDDARAWDLVLKSGLIFDILQDEHAVAESTVSYPLSSRRFVRLTIPGLDRSLAIAGSLDLGVQRNQRYPRYAGHVHAGGARRRENTNQRIDGGFWFSRAAL